jgi:hypothetical protein
VDQPHPAVHDLTPIGPATGRPPSNGVPCRKINRNS